MAFTVPDYFRVKEVTGFAELAARPFADGINALCWPRTLSGDFASVVQLLDRQRRAPDLLMPGLDALRPGSLDQNPSENEGLTSIEPTALECLLNLPPSSFVLKPATRAAINVLLEDLRLLRDLNRDPVLNLIHGYSRDDTDSPVRTDVFSFHADSAPIAADTWLCTYHGPPSEGLRNDDAVRKIDVPEIRAELLTLHGGDDDEAFREFLQENHFDLHYAAIAGAPPYSFGHFNFWRIACDYPGAPVPPCIHRAPSPSQDDPPRLLLIS